MSALMRLLAIAPLIVAAVLGAPGVASAHHQPGHAPCEWGGDPVQCETSYGLWFHENACYMKVPLPEPPPSYEGWDGHAPYGHVYWAWCNYDLPWPPKHEPWSGWDAASTPGVGDSDKGPLWYGEAPDVEEIAQQAIEAEIGPDLPSITLQPLNALINFPMIASTEPRGPLSVELTQPPGAVVTGTPEFTWSFGDGGRGSGPGREYDGTSPLAYPDYYVDHAYRSLGTPVVTLTVTWHVRLTIPGGPPIELQDVVREAETSTVVRTAWSELVDG